jgi:hypothetical protein
LLQARVVLVDELVDQLLVESLDREFHVGLPRQQDLADEGVLHRHQELEAVHLRHRVVDHHGRAGLEAKAVQDFEVDLGDVDVRQRV